MFSKALISLNLKNTFALVFILMLGFSFHADAAENKCADIFQNEVTKLQLNSQHQILNWFEEKNPKLTRKEILEKIADTTDTFTLYRSFVTNFYDMILKDPDLMKSLKPLLNQTGWMFGDPHLKNFGSAILNNTRSIFTMTDLDDGGHGPMALDVVRFLTSAIIFNPTIDSEKLLSSYLDGLNKNTEVKSKSVENFLQKASRLGPTPLDELFDKKTKMLIRNASVTEISQNQVKKFSLVIKENYSQKLKLIDQIEFLRTRGGSGGLLRYELLLKNAKGDFLVIELKEMTTSGMIAFADSKIPTAKVRIKKGLKFTQGEDVSELFSYAKIDDSRFELRPRFNGNMNVTLDEFNPEDSTDMVLHEAWTLGSLHRKTADDQKSYAKSFLENRQAIENVSQTLASRFEQLFAKLQNLVNQPAR